MKKAIKILKRWHYTIGAILLVVGFILLRVFLYTQAKRILPEIQVVVPGVSEFYLPQPGEYTKFLLDGIKKLRYNYVQKSDKS